MHHVAIMKPELRFLEKILSGQKVIESRWLSQRRAPWHKVQVGDTIFFKNSSQPVSVKALVKKVIYFEDLTPLRVREVLAEHSKSIGIEDRDSFYIQTRYKRYCVLIWLKHIEPISPFYIQKVGFGAMTAWLSVEDIAVLKRRH